jgi:hypothetical protein
MSREQPPSTSEQKYPHWEMQLSWGDLLVAVLERKVIAEDDPSYPTKRFDWCQRQFTALNGDALIIGGDPQSSIQMWTINITPKIDADSDVAYNTAPSCEFVIDRDDDNEAYKVEIRDGDQHFPIAPQLVEALLGTIATMVPTSETEYILRPNVLSQ